VYKEAELFGDHVSNDITKTLIDQPNAHYGLGALSAWGRSSQGIFSFPPEPPDYPTSNGAAGAVKPEGCPNGLGGVSA